MKILVCEDDVSTREIIRVTLSPRGHELTITETAQEAVRAFDAARKAGKPYDLIITDIYMPGDSGFYLAGYARGLDFKGRIAALTAGEVAEMKENIAAVNAEYWPKPDAMGNLVQRVEGANGSA